MSQGESTCALCGQKSPLRLSHITPAFVTRYLKETSATGYLRDAIQPNMRRQDVRKEPLLCERCEQLFSVWEREFSLRAFPIVQADEFSELPYDEWLLKFAVSLSWRVLVIDTAKLVQDYPQFENIIEGVLQEWRVFLLGRRRSIKTEHHLFVFSGIPQSLSGKFHPKLLHYMLRGIDATIAVSKRQLGVYIKLMRSLFYSPITPNSPEGWIRTKVHNGPGKIVSPQSISMRGFGDFLNDRVAEVFSEPLSEAQNQTIAKAILANPARAINSESFKVHEATQRFRKQLTED